MSEPVERVRRVIFDAFDAGTLGVLAARNNIAERRLRNFALGDVHALTVEEIVALARAVPREKLDPI